jgi:hypothetical protein
MAKLTKGLAPTVNEPIILHTHDSPPDELVSVDLNITIDGKINEAYVTILKDNNINEMLCIEPHYFKKLSQVFAQLASY